MTLHKVLHPSAGSLRWIRPADSAVAHARECATPLTESQARNRVAYAQESSRQELGRAASLAGNGAYASSGESVSFSTLAP